ncbi:MAG: hypothetical protein WKF75_05645, partial [Singulisphaera sp.]
MAGTKGSRTPRSTGPQEPRKLKVNLSLEPTLRRRLGAYAAWFGRAESDTSARPRSNRSPPRSTARPTPRSSERPAERPCDPERPGRPRPSARPDERERIRPARTPARRNPSTARTGCEGGAAGGRAGRP